jgi:mannitol-1-phosphate/altronate dehydrogenase
MVELRNDSLRSIRPEIRIPGYDRSQLRPGIVHLGVGNFHRVHQATVVDQCLHLPGNQEWAISGVGLTNGVSAQEKAAAYRAQDNLYTVTELRSDMSMVTEVIGAMVEYLHAPQNPGLVLERLADPGTRIVSLTITEGGYNIDEKSGEFRLDNLDVVHDLSGGPPRTAFGFIVLALRARREAGHQPFTVLSCDNLRSNGNTTRRAIVSFARALSPDLAGWIEENGAFPNSMVDRIAPQVQAEDRQRLNASSGVNDRLPASCESYTKWVIEDRFSAGRPELELGGVEFRSDVAAFEAVKGRLSNAAHMMMCYPSLLMGHRLVHMGMSEAQIGRLLQNFWDLDVFPLVTPPTGFSVQTFTQQVLERFANPAIRDQLLRVAHDGAAKIIVFHAKTIRELIKNGSDLTREAFLLASFSRYLGGVDDLGNHFEVNEPQFNDHDWRILNGSDPSALLHTVPFRSLELDQCQRFRELYLGLRIKIASSGIGTALSSILV